MLIINGHTNQFVKTIGSCLHYFPLEGARESINKNVEYIIILIRRHVSRVVKNKDRKAMMCCGTGFNSPI